MGVEMKCDDPPQASDSNLYQGNSIRTSLPTAYGVWGKVMFHRRVSFCSQGGEGASRMQPLLDAPPCCSMDAPSPTATWMHPHLNIPPSSWMHPPPLARRQTVNRQAVGTHPTGMHFCLITKFLSLMRWEN